MPIDFKKKGSVNFKPASGIDFKPSAAPKAEQPYSAENPEPGLEEVDDPGMAFAKNVTAPLVSYPSGIVNTAAAGAAALPGSLVGLKQLPMKRVGQALMGNAASPGELAEDIGVPAGPEIGHVGGHPINLRNLAAFLLSARIDPLNKLGGDEIRPIATAANKTGRNMYRNAFGTVDRAMRKNKNFEGEATPFSDFAYESKVFKPGSPQQLEQNLKDYKDEVLGPVYNELYDKSTSLVPLGERAPSIPQPPKSVSTGVLDASGKPITKQVPVPDVEGDFGIHEYLFPEAREKIAKFSTQGPNKKGAARLGNMIAEDAEEGVRTPREVAELATSYSDMARGVNGLPGDVMNLFGSKNAGKETAMAISNDLRDLARTAAGSENPGMLNLMLKVNPIYQRVAGAEKPLNQLVSREMGKHAATQVDAGMAGAAVADPKHFLRWLTALASKNGMRYLNSPSGAVRVGNTLRTMGEQNVWDQLLRRGVLDATKGE